MVSDIHKFVTGAATWKSVPLRPPGNFVFLRRSEDICWLAVQLSR